MQYTQVAEMYVCTHTQSRYVGLSLMSATNNILTAVTEIS